MSATHTIDSATAVARVLYLAFELGNTSWKLAFTTGAGQKPRIRTIPARSLTMLLDEIAKAKQKLRLPECTPVISCYEAGRDGFWLHRFLAHHRVENLIVDAASIEVKRRKHRAKSDNLDGTKLVGMFIRWHLGKKKLWIGLKGQIGLKGSGAESANRFLTPLISSSIVADEPLDRSLGTLDHEGRESLAAPGVRLFKRGEVLGPLLDLDDGVRVTVS